MCFLYNAVCYLKCTDMPISSLQLEIHLEMGSVNFMFETFENFIKLIFIVNVFKTFKN